MADGVGTIALLADHIKPSARHLPYLNNSEYSSKCLLSVETTRPSISIPALHVADDKLVASEEVDSVCPMEIMLADTISSGKSMYGLDRVASNVSILISLHALNSTWSQLQSSQYGLC